MLRPVRVLFGPRTKLFFLSIWSFSISIITNLFFMIALQFCFCDCITNCWFMQINRFNIVIFKTLLEAFWCFGESVELAVDVGNIFCELATFAWEKHARRITNFWFFCWIRQTSHHIFTWDGLSFCGCFRCVLLCCLERDVHSLPEFFLDRFIKTPSASVSWTTLETWTWSFLSKILLLDEYEHAEKSLDKQYLRKPRFLNLSKTLFRCVRKPSLFELNLMYLLSSFNT